MNYPLIGYAEIKGNILAFRGLFIGVDKYQSPEISWLGCSSRDATALYALFTDTLGGQSIYLTNNQATKKAIQDALEMLTNVEEEDVVFISFSGHGSETHELIPYDCDVSDLPNTSIKLEELKERFSKIPAKRLVLLLDCCFSGGIGSKVLKVDVKPRSLDSVGSILEKISGEGRIILTASSPDEPAFESAKVGHGLLTHFFLMALQGAEEVRQSGKVEVYKLLQFITQNVTDAADQFGHKQNPTLRGTIDGALSWPIFKPGKLYQDYFPDRSYAKASGDLRSLLDFGFPEKLIETWASAIPSLNALQVDAINEFGILQGEHLLVSTPTSSGKTMVGELAALKSAIEGKRALFLLPLKALVNDKNIQFSKIYSDFGIRTIEATGETDDISPLLRGRYDIALLTYEKFAGILLTNPHVLEQVGTIVIDEVQMIADPSRGANLEFLLTMVRVKKNEGIEPQLLALSAVIGDTRGFEGWLGGRLMKREERPIPLDEGLLSLNGSYRYLDGKTGEEKKINQIVNPYFGRKSTSQQIIIPLVEKIVKEGGQVIIFRETKSEVRYVAKYLAETLKLSSADDLLGNLPAGDLSIASSELRECLSNGVAFHYSDLDRSERLIMEEGFREKKIRVIAATTTLAMGINTPATDVIVVGLDHPGPSPYTVAEYKNIVGRAGRLGISDKGRSYLIAKNQGQEHRYWQHYILGKPEDLFSRFLDNDTDPRTLILRVVSLAQKISPEGCSRNEIVSFLDSSFGAFQQRQEKGNYSYDGNCLNQALNELQNHDLITETIDGLLQLTKLGFLAGESIIEVNSIIRFVDCLRRLNPADFSDPALLVILQVSEELDQVYMPVNKKSK